MRLPHRPRPGLPLFAFLILSMAVTVVSPALGAMTAPQPAPQAAPAPDGVAPFFLPAATPDEREQAIACLAETIYYEAAFEPLEGQRAVAQVVVNRVRDPNFPGSVCGVVYQGWTRKTGCQFSFVCDGSLQRRPPRADQIAFTRIVARQALEGYVDAKVGTATHYHTDYVDPYWAPTLVEIAQIGTHIFYRWPGKAGRPTALTDQYAGGEVALWRTANGQA